MSSLFDPSKIGTLQKWIINKVITEANVKIGAKQ